VNGVSKTKRVTNHMRILVQWWCMRICACSGFLLSGGSGGCFDGILADRTKRVLFAWTNNDESAIIFKIWFYIYLRTCTVFHPRSRLTSVLSIGDDALWFLCALIPGFNNQEFKTHMLLLRYANLSMAGHVTHLYQSWVGLFRVL